MAQERLQEALSELRELAVRSSQVTSLSKAVMFGCALTEALASLPRLLQAGPCPSGAQGAGVLVQSVQLQVPHSFSYTLHFVLLLQGIVPREAAVHVMMGKLHKRLRNPDAALTAFSTGTVEFVRQPSSSWCLGSSHYLGGCASILSISRCAAVVYVLCCGCFCVCSAGPEAGSS
jgi:hypothetical protein